MTDKIIRYISQNAKSKRVKGVGYFISLQLDSERIEVKAEDKLTGLIKLSNIILNDPYLRTFVEAEVIIRTFHLN